MWPPEFTLDRERILRLLTGDRFYSNSSAALREAILNALDAVHRRRAEEPNHEVRIDVTFDSSSQELIVSDNGDGMNRSDVETLFTRIGASAAEFDEHGSGMVGEFGIGVVSYFMASDEFEIETWNGKEDQIGLRFRREMFAGQPAEEIEPGRTERGTTLRLALRDPDTYALLLEQFPHWCRRVDGLTAIELPANQAIPQGDVVDSVRHVVEVGIPEGVEAAFLRPIETVQAWEAMSGASTVTILYRGVFVQEFVATGLWGAEGSILVDPKHFKPRLNREGFVGSEFASEIQAFVGTAHPSILAELADSLSQAVDEGAVDKWTARRWATLWLSVPRDGAYEQAAAKWDAAFRRMPAFELAKGDQWVPSSVDDLVGLTGPIFVAPHREDRQDDLIKSATRLLRQTGKPVLRGLARDPNWLRGAGNFFSTTADLIGDRFREELPELRPIASHAEEILEALEAIHDLYGGEYPVVLVRLGEESPPVLKVGRRLLVNTEVEAGRSIVLRALAHNRGRRGLIEVAAELAPQYLTQVAAVANATPPSDEEVLGLVKRRYLRTLLE